MSDKLVIVESPSKAKTIKKYLGKDFEVIASQGHIIDLPASKFGVDVEKDFKPEYITMKGKAKILKQIKDEAKDKKVIYLATDPDREGEAIAWHLKNTLKIKDSDKCRIEFNEITENAVKNAVKNARKIDQNLVDAQQARRILDRIVGYKISPILWKKLKKGLSAGRVQSVALKIIIDRERLIKNFIPEEYWNLTVKLKKAGEKTLIIAKFYGDTKKKIELKNGEQVKQIVDKINNKQYVVKEIKKSERKKNPPPPFTTSSIQQEASRKLGYSVKKTMSVAQKLYEAGHITYMRTDSTRISDEARSMAREYIVSTFGEKYYLNRVYKTKDTAQDAHEAIRPTHINNVRGMVESLTNDEKKLYMLIYNRFLASQMEVAVYDTTKVVIQVEDYIFVANGSILKFDGFMKLYIESKDEETNNKDNNEELDEDDYLLPDLKVSDVLEQKDLKPEQKFTEPPARYTEASLVKVLEEKGIGRPSTYAPTISTILDRMYIEKDKKYLIPTDLGNIVNELMEKNFKDIVDVTFTAGMENKLDNIADGNENYVKMLKEFYTPFISNLAEVEKNQEKVKIPEEISEEVCEYCGKNMVIKQGRYGKFLACPGYPECKNAKPIVNSIDVACPKCGGKILVKKTKNKKTFYVCENSPKTCDYISWIKPKNENKK
ncbi:MAG: type I DNA topoisomerase [Clostridia bacterium]|nr:type I DNA topoisomerase [Clostridia bacterium]